MEPIELILTIASVFLFGVQIGDYLGERKTSKVAEPLFHHYFRQKNEMWRELRRRV